MPGVEVDQVVNTLSHEGIVNLGLNVLTMEGQHHANVDLHRVLTDTDMLDSMLAAIENNKPVSAWTLEVVRKTINYFTTCER